jgi:two-component sensor histidine kinase
MKWRLFAVAATAIFPTLVSLGYNEFSVRQTYMADVYSEALRGSRLSQFEVEQVIDEVAAVLWATTTIDAVASHSGAACVDILERLVKNDPAIASISMIGLDGHVLCSSETEPDSASYADKSYFKLALATKSRAVGELVMDEGAKQFELPISVPVRGAKGELIGVLAADMPIAWLGDRIRERGVATGAALTIADRDGYIIARNPYPERFVGTRIPDAFMAKVHADKPGTMAVISQDGTRRILGYQPPAAGTLGLYVSAGVSEEEAFALVDRTTASGVMAILSGLMLGLAAAWFIGGRFIYRPVRQIVDTVNAWRAGAIEVRTNLTSRDGDLGSIGHALDEFIAELAGARAASERAEAHRDLLMHELGHRVKNTLSITISIANQMFRNTPDERDAFAARLTALSGAYDLLLADDWTSADIGAVVEQTLTPHVHSRDQIEASGPLVGLPAQLVLALSLVLHELATNAVKYGSLSTEAGRLIVNWELMPEASNLVVMTWREEGGPPVTPPTRRGFGSKLLVRAFQSQFNSRIDFDYAAEGLRCRIEFQIPAPTEAVADFLS